MRTIVFKRNNRVLANRIWIPVGFCIMRHRMPQRRSSVSSEPNCKVRDGCGQTFLESVPFVLTVSTPATERAAGTAAFSTNRWSVSWSAPLNAVMNISESFFEVVQLSCSIEPLPLAILLFLGNL
jgi:hypothetical protein